MAIHIIVAMTKDRVMGKDGAIPWHIAEDAKLFRELTTNSAVIMGKNTWLSLPERFRPLPNRVNIVVSSKLTEQKGAIVCKSVKDAVAVARGTGSEVYCMGGAQLYAEMLPLTQVLHISWVKKSYEGDIHFPELDLSKWKEEETREFAEFTYKRYALLY